VVKQFWTKQDQCAANSQLMNCVMRQTLMWSTTLWSHIHWPNRLPTELKLLRSTDLFRRDLKTFLFHSVYGHQHANW